MGTRQFKPQQIIHILREAGIKLGLSRGDAPAERSGNLDPRSAGLWWRATMKVR